MSRTTADALRELIPEALDKTTVIHHGVGPPFEPLPPEEVEAFTRRLGMEQYFLFVGTTKPHKNLDLVLRAFAIFRESFPEIQLAVVGVDSGQVSTVGDGVRSLGRVNDHDLARLYNGAEAVLMPSLCEGFGFPLIEALSCGTPAIASKIPAHLEVAGQAAFFIDCPNEEHLIGAMERTLTDRQLVESLRDAGRKRAGLYSWAETAARTRQVYHEVAQTTGR